MSSLRDALRRLLRPEEQSRSARTVEIYGWALLVEGGLILVGPAIVAGLLQLPEFTEQGERYFRILGLLVAGVGLLYTVSGRMNAEGFVFATLIDRPLVPVIMAILWYRGIVPVALGAVFAAQDFGTFLWTLAAWRQERRLRQRPFLERELAFADDLESPSIRAMQMIYSAVLFDELKMFQVVERLATLLQSGALPLGRGHGARKLYQYAEELSRRLPESERRAVYQRAFGLGGGGDVDANRDFNGLWLRFLSAVRSLVAGGAGASQEPVRQAGRDLVSNLSLHGFGTVYLAATELQPQMRDVLDILADPEIQSAAGARDAWQVVERISARDLGGAANSVKLRTLQAAGATILCWLARKSGELGRRSSEPIVRVGAEPRPDRSGPGDQDLVEAVERWLAAST